MKQYKKMFEAGYKFFEEDDGWLPYELEDWEQIEGALTADEEEWLCVSVKIDEENKEVIIRISDDE